MTAETITDRELADFFDGYVTAALLSSNDNADESGGEPLDSNYGLDDITPETRAAMRADCVKFLESALPLIRQAEALADDDEWILPQGADCTVMEYAGHDFWLTRAGHGVGFWDGDWPDGIGEALDKLAESFGEYNLYVGDNGQIDGD